VGVTVTAFLVIASFAAAENPPTAESITVSVLAVQASDEDRNRDAGENVAQSQQTKKKGVSQQLRQGFAQGNSPKPKTSANASHFDPGLEEIREAVATFPYDTYRKVSSETSTLAPNEEAKFAVNSAYTLFLTPLDKDENGRLRVRVRIEEKSTRNGAPVTITALNTTSAIAPGKHLMLGGLPLSEGKLIVFISLKP